MLPILLLISLVTHFNMGQSPGSHREWSVLARQSTNIVVCVVEEELWVVRPGKMATGTKQLPDGTILMELPKPSDYLIGRVIRVRTVEVLKEDPQSKARDVIDIFVPGTFHGESSPLFERNKKYLVFLTRIKDTSKKYADTVVCISGSPSVQQGKFDAESSYSVVWGKYGMVNVTPENNRLVEEIKMSIRSS